MSIFPVVVALLRIAAVKVLKRVLVIRQTKVTCHRFRVSLCHGGTARARAQMPAAIEEEHIDQGLSIRIGRDLEVI
jgi:hypothetical protein